MSKRSPEGPRNVMKGLESLKYHPLATPPAESVIEDVNAAAIEKPAKISEVDMPVAVPETAMIPEAQEPKPKAEPIKAVWAGTGESPAQVLKRRVTELREPKETKIQPEKKKNQPLDLSEIGKRYDIKPKGLNLEGHYNPEEGFEVQNKVTLTPESRKEWKSKLGGLIKELRTRTEKPPKVEKSVEATAPNKQKESFVSNGKFAFLEQAKLAVSKEAAQEQAAAKTYFELEKRSHAKDKKTRPSKAEIERAQKEYNQKRIEYGNALNNALAKESLEVTSGTAWQEKADAHFQKLQEQNRVPRNKAGKEMTKEEYVTNFEHKLIDRNRKIGRLYEIAIPHHERKLQSRIDRLDGKGQNIVTKSLGWIHQKNKQVETGIANLLVQKSKGKISEKWAKRIGKIGARSAMVLSTSLIVGGATVAAGSIFGVMSGAAALGYIGARGAGIGSRLLIGAGGGLGAGAIYEKFFASKDAKRLFAAKRSTLYDENRLKNLDKAFEIGTREAITKRREMVEILGTSAASFGMSAQHMYELVHHLSSAQEAAERLAALKEVTGHSGVNGGGGTTPEVVHHSGGISKIPEASKISHVPSAPSIQSHVGDTPLVSPEAPKAESPFPPVRITTGTGADKLFSNFHKLIDDQKTHSPLIDSILKQNPHVLAQKLGFPEHNVNGYMQPGDSIQIENKELVFNRGHNPGVVLMHEDGTINENAREEIQKLTSHHHHLPQHHEQAPAREQSPVQDAPKIESSPGTPVHTETPHGAAAELPPNIKNPDGAEASDYLNRTHNTFPSHEAPHTSASDTYEHAPTPVPAPEQVAPVIQNAPPSVDAITHTDGWQKYHDFDASKVLMSSPQGGDATAITFRTQLFSIMRESGVGPQTGETIDHYAARAADAMRDHTLKGLPRYDTYPAIYKASDGHLQIHGGDLEARFAVANEYLSKHPDAEMVMENPGQRTPFFLYSKSAMDSAQYPAIDITKLKNINGQAELVF